MARQLVFRIKRKEYPVVPVRVDRKKLYGWTEVVALDENGSPCELAGTDESGQYIVPRGGTAIGILSAAGDWVDRSSLKYVDSAGAPAELLPSSYASVVELKEKVTVDRFLEYTITMFYQLTEAPEEMAEKIGEDIYHFLYCYVNGCEGYPAFVLRGEDRTLFLLVGVKNEFELLSLEEPGWIDETGEDDASDEEDGIDFSMF